MTMLRRIAPYLAAFMAFVVFMPALDGEFVRWDDFSNLSANQSFRGLGPEQLRWMWTTFHMGHYIPLSWMTLGADYLVWGMDPRGYHLTNLVLHSVNAVLLYHLTRRLILRAQPQRFATETPVVLAALFAALLFAVHPLRVESVAWITERRDGLSLLFMLATILAYLRFVEGAARRRAHYVLAVALFACALLSKAIAMVTPGLLLVINMYPLRRLGGMQGFTGAEPRRVYRELVPFALLAGATAALSVVALSAGRQYVIDDKLAASVYSYAFYLWKTLLPVGLAPLYERPVDLDATAPRMLASYFAAIAVLVATWRARRRHPTVAACVAAFTIALLPLLGFVQNGPQIAADRYTHHAAPALAILAGCAFLVVPRPTRLIPVGLLVVATLSALTWQQSHVWRNSESVWQRVLAVDSTSAFAHNNLGELRASRGRRSQAIAHYERAIMYRPGYADPHANLGLELTARGETVRAIEHLRRALELQPDHMAALLNLGNVLLAEGDFASAVECYRRAATLMPEHAGAEFNWGVALARQGDYAASIPHFRRAIELDPKDTDARAYLVRAQQHLGQPLNGR